MTNMKFAFIEILDMDASPNPILPNYSDREEGQPWTWREWCDQPTKAATTRGGKLYIGAGTFAAKSLCLTLDEYDTLTAAGVVLIHPDDLPVEEDIDNS